MSDMGTNVYLLCADEDKERLQLDLQQAGLTSNWRVVKLPTGGPYTILEIITGIDPAIYYPTTERNQLAEIKRCGEIMLEKRCPCDDDEFPSYTVTLHKEYSQYPSNRNVLFDSMVKECGIEHVLESTRLFVLWCEIGIKHGAEMDFY